MHLVKNSVKHCFQLFFPQQYRKWTTKRQYRRLAEETSQMNFAFMNYGYSNTDDSAGIELSMEDEPYRYHIQLYHHLIYDIDLKGKQVLEVGCGRGGGCHYIKKNFKPQSITGIDLSESAIRLCNDKFKSANINFQIGDAENMPFDPESFDNVLNLESSHCYPNIQRFFMSVWRILRKNGYFHYSDFGTTERMEDVEALLSKMGFRFIKKTDITDNVVESLLADNARKESIFNSITKDPDRYHVLVNFARMVGTEGFESFRSKREVYLSYLLQT